MTRPLFRPIGPHVPARSLPGPALVALLAEQAYPVRRAKRRLRVTLADLVRRLGLPGLGRWRTDRVTGGWVIRPWATALPGALVAALFRVRVLRPLVAHRLVVDLFALAASARRFRDRARDDAA